MFNLEATYAQSRRRSLSASRRTLLLNEQKQWQINKPADAIGVGLADHGVYAQNERYLEVPNAGFGAQCNGGIGVVLIMPLVIFMVWVWYGFTIHPLLTGVQLIFVPWHPWKPTTAGFVFGWVFAFPMALGCCYMFISLWLDKQGMRTAFFTYARGRIRFNRQTRKVYVLRPKAYGGDAVFEWDRLRALMHSVDPKHPAARRLKRVLVLYHPPFDDHDPDGKGEDAIYVGKERDTPEHVAHFWEYIRLYMEEGPTMDYIPEHAPATLKQIPRHFPWQYSTYCGKPDAMQYALETRASKGAAILCQLSLMTCTWPQFPKEWGSDSGLGEPEDRPVQTGALMTALVYKMKGQLSSADDAAFGRLWGSEESSMQAMRWWRR